MYVARYIAKNAFSSRATWSPVFKTLKNSNFKVSKKKKILEVDNCIHYDLANF
jgi:hypothetical protein